MKKSLQQIPRFEWLSNTRAVRIRGGFLHGASFVMALALIFAGHGQLTTHPLWSAFVLFCFGIGYAVAASVFKDSAYVYPTLGLWTFAFFLLCFAIGIPPLDFPLVATLLLWILWITAPKLDSTEHFSDAVYRCSLLTSIIFGCWALFHHADQQQIPAATFVLYGLSMVVFHLRRPRSSYAYSAGIYLAIGIFFCAKINGLMERGQVALAIQSVVLLILLLAVLEHHRHPFTAALPFYATGFAITVFCLGMSLMGRLLLDQLALTAFTLGVPLVLHEQRQTHTQSIPPREKYWLIALNISSQAAQLAAIPLIVIAPILEMGHALWSSLLLGLFCLLTLLQRSAGVAAGTIHRLVFFAGMGAAWLIPATRGEHEPHAMGVAVTALLCVIVSKGIGSKDNRQRLALTLGDGLATVAAVLVCIAVFTDRWDSSILLAALICLACSLTVARRNRLPVWSAAAAFGAVGIVVLAGFSANVLSQWLIVEFLAGICLLGAYYSNKNRLRMAVFSVAALTLAVSGISLALHLETADVSVLCLAASLGVSFALPALFYEGKYTYALWAVIALDFIGIVVLLWVGRLVSVALLGSAWLVLVPFLAVGWLKSRTWAYALSTTLFFALGILLIAGSELGTGWQFMVVAALICAMMLRVQSDKPSEKTSFSAVKAVGHMVAMLVVLTLCQRGTGIMQWQTAIPLLIAGISYHQKTAKSFNHRSVAWMFYSLAIIPLAGYFLGSDTGTFLIIPAILVPAWAIVGLKAGKTENQLDCCHTSALLGLLLCLIGTVRGPDQASSLFILCLAGFLVCLLARRNRFYVHLVLLGLALMGYGWIQQYGSHFSQELYFYLLLILGFATIIEISPYLAGYFDSIIPIPFFRLMTWRGLGLGAVVGILVTIASASGFTLAITEHPIFCMSCHNMGKYYASWQHSSHQDVACVECHYEPGFTAHLQGKIGALSQVTSYLTHRYDVKPHAEVSNRSCLRSGCHSNIDQNTDAFFKDKVHFSHNLHHDVIVKDRDMPCTICHSQEAESEHMGLACSTCFLCHFYGEGAAKQKTSSCISCHGAPQGKIDMGTSSFNHDDFFSGRSVSCQVCHLSATQGDASPHSVRCLSCHYGEQMEKLNEVAVNDIHEKHVLDEKISCFECHGILKHGAPVKVAMADAQECASCHETTQQHSLQAKMYMGTAVAGLPGEPNVMLDAGISCRHCHIEKTRLNLGGKEFLTHVSTAEYCANCHGDKDYMDTFTMWQEDTKALLESTGSMLEKTRARLDSTAPAMSAPELEKLHKRLNRADELRNVVIADGSMGIHSYFYVEEILNAANAEIKAVEASLNQME